MDIIKVTRTEELSNLEIPGAKFEAPACTWCDCHQQCTCPGLVNQTNQYTLARDFYTSHHDNWW
jgi:hypothetical protein